MKITLLSLFACTLYAGSVQVIPLENTPHNSDMNVEFHTNNEVLSRNNPLHFRLKSYPLGMNTYSPKLMGMKQNPLGTTVVMFFNGDQRVYLRKIDTSALEEKKRYFEKDFCKYLPTKIAKELPEGKNCITVIALNSYGESIKNKVGIDTRIVDYSKRVPRDQNLEDKIQKPYILYNEPFGNYLKGEPILLDFIALNTAISPRGNKVVVKIDGDVVATIDKNVPHKITGLPRGKHSIVLTLVDSSGRALPIPFKAQEGHIIVE